MEFREYYSRETIIKYLCKIRISYSSKRHKKQLLNNLVYKENHLKKINDSYDNEILNQLNLILPKRRQWLTHNSKTHIKCLNPNSGKLELRKIDTDDKNKQILFNTIKRHSKNKLKYPYQFELDKFISEIQNGITNCNYKISTPNIVPELKETNKSKKKYNISKNLQFDCRPISRFSLMDRIVISITNKYLTVLFDQHFEPSSLAFRAKTKNQTEEKNHHIAINKIIEFKKQNSNVDLFVAECDIKKFYDTVNHNKCLDLFNNLLEASSENHDEISKKSSKYIFKEYLNCYDFRNVVMSKDHIYWAQQFHSNSVPINGKFPWIESDINNSEFYKVNPDQKIGVPQGGALSGLIANIMLDEADRELKAIPNLFYVRYCDDMIIMHKDENICKKAIEVYIKTLKDLLLFSHPFETLFYIPNRNYSSKYRIFIPYLISLFNYSKFLNNLNSSFDRFIKRFFPKIGIRHKKKYNLTYKYSLKKFWNCKSKGPYKWGALNIQNNTFPWIGFVGYEIDHNCNTRVRKRSLKKEIDKQKKVITSILKRISKENFKYKKSRNNAIYRSALEKLNGMAVGRVKSYNYKVFVNKICWTTGFKSLNFNKYSKVQLRKLDRSKYKYLYILRHNLGIEKAEGTPLDNNTKNIYKIGKMFSYFFQAGQKNSGT